MGVNFINCLRPIGALRPTFAPIKSFSKVGGRAQIGRKTVYEIVPGCVCAYVWSEMTTGTYEMSKHLKVVSSF